MIETHEVHLVKRPVGLPKPECFEIVTVQLPEIDEGQALVKNLWMSVDPYMRGRMDEDESYIPPFALGQVMEGGAIGRVIASKSHALSVGDYVESMRGWREHFVISDSRPGDDVRVQDPNLVPLQTYLGVAGMPGLTAYSGMTWVAEVKAGETVFVSGAAGAVGSAACQIAKIAGCTVIGSAGSESKIDWLKESAGVDVAFNYKTVSIADALAEAAPEGIDAYFENVGGEHLSAAISRMKPFGRVALCGLIADYNIRGDINEQDLFSQILSNSLQVQGFIVTQFYDRYPEFLEKVSAWIRDRCIRWEETVFDGIHNAPSAFLGLFSGQNFGKMLVKLTDDRE